MSSYVLDTSAVLTLIEDEAGADRVEAVLRQEKVWMPWVVLMETYYITFRKQGQNEAEQRYALLRQMAPNVLWEADEALLLTAARLKASSRLSLADAVIASFAIWQGATLLHKDPEFEALSEQVLLEALPYKE